MDYKYHITDLSNLESIIKDGLKPSIGHHRQNCKIDIERESDDPRVSLCDEKNVLEWKNALYKKSPDTETVILKVMVDGLNMKRRLWRHGYEYACWDHINPDRITVINENEFNHE